MVSPLFTDSSTAHATQIFGLGVVIYELFTKTMTAVNVIITGAPTECSDYAWQVHFLAFRASRIRSHRLWV